MKPDRPSIVPVGECPCPACNQVRAELAAMDLGPRGYRLVFAFLVAFGLFMAVLLVAAVAGAQGLGSGIGDPCAPGAYDPDGGPAIVSVTLPDGGPEDVPATICPGQRAPVAGVLLTVPEAARRAGERAGDRVRIAALEHQVEQADRAAPALLGALSGAVTVAVTLWCATHDCNPLHAGRK